MERRCIAYEVYRVGGKQIKEWQGREYIKYIVNMYENLSKDKFN